LVTGFVFVITALPGDPGVPLSPRRLRSSSPRRGPRYARPVGAEYVVSSIDRVIVLSRGTAGATAYRRCRRQNATGEKHAADGSETERQNNSYSWALVPDLRRTRNRRPNASTVRPHRRLRPTLRSKFDAAGSATGTTDSTCRGPLIHCGGISGTAVAVQGSLARPDGQGVLPAADPTMARDRSSQRRQSMHGPSCIGHAPGIRRGALPGR
jgi:hypothetical protein